MFSRTSLVAALVVTVAAAFTGVGFASTERAGHARDLKLFAVVTATTQVDVDGDGAFSVGDAIVVKADDYDRPGGTQVGTGTVTCIAIDVTTGDLDCQGSDVLPGGEIREAGRGVGSDPTHFQWAIVGGTGKYRGVSGELDGTFVDAQLSQAALTFKLVK